MPSLEALLKKDRLLVLLTLAGLIAMSWLGLVLMAQDMGSPAMSEMPLMMAAPEPWDLKIAVTVFLMWAIMMVGMMLPGAAPVILLNAALMRRSAGTRPVQSYTMLFLLGYLASWTVFSAVATAAQWWLTGMQLMSPMMRVTSTTLNGAILICAGVYQWLPPKTACLRHCRTPAAFLAQHRRHGAPGAFLMGVHHGNYCVGCCWLLMLLLFVGGVMSLLWIAFLAAFVLAEKVLPFGIRFSRASGATMIAAGVLLAFR